MDSRELANHICDSLIRKGFEALLVGGCVRDILLKRQPADFDVTTSARPEEVMSLFPDSVGVGAQFGVVLVPRNSVKVEVATFRSDIGYSDGRHPDRIAYAQTAREDVQRRDFTINGMLMRHDSGEVLDFVGGQADLGARTIRTIGEPARRFEEDKLRMLRAVRFAARFGYRIEPETWTAIRKRARQITEVSAERTRDELSKLLTEGAAKSAFELLERSWLLSIVLPEISAMKGIEQPPQYHPEGDVWTHTLLMLEGLREGSSPTLAWGVLLHDVGKPATFRSAKETGDRIRFDGHVDVGTRMAEQICRRLRFSSEDTDQIVRLVANHMRFKDVQQMRTATLKKFVRLPRFDEHLELHRLDCLSSHRNLEALEFVRSFLRETPPDEVRPQRLLSGEDLAQMGYVPGPIFKRILADLEDAQLEGDISDREAAVKFVRSHYPVSSLHSQGPKDLG